MRAPYTFALKLRIAQAIVDKGSSQSSVARTFGLSATTVGEWVRRTGRAERTLCVRLRA